MAPVTFTDDFEDCMFQMPLIGKEYNLDSRTFYVELKALLFGGKEYSWIEHYDHGANGRAAFQKRVDHYNGAWEINKRAALSKARMKELHYKNE